MIKQVLVCLVLVVGSCEKPAARPSTAPATGSAVRRVHVFISGKVQGVGFRAFTKDRADEVGVKGWVKNLLDGRVESIMQGRGDGVEKLLESVKKGPRSARVDGVEIKDEKIGDEFADFRVIEGQ
jgi:acylphosphatase